MNSYLNHPSLYTVNANSTFTLPEAIKTSAFAIHQQSNTPLSAATPTDAFEPQSQYSSIPIKKKASPNLSPWVWVAGLGTLVLGGVVFHKDIGRVLNQALNISSVTEDHVHKTATQTVETLHPVMSKVPDVVHQHLQHTLQRFKIQPSFVDLAQPTHNGSVMSFPSMTYDAWVASLQNAKEIHLGDEHGHLLKPILTLFASGAIRFKHDAQGAKLKELLHIMEATQVHEDINALVQTHLPRWQQLLADLEMDANVPFINGMHDALGDRNGHDVFNIPFYLRLVELSKPHYAAGRGFVPHTSNHGLQGLAVLVNNLNRGTASVTHVHPDQAPSFELAWQGLPREKVQELLVVPYLQLMQECRVMSYRPESKHLTTHATLTQESDEWLKELGVRVSNWQDEQQLINATAQVNQALKDTVTEVIKANTVGKSVSQQTVENVDALMNLSFVRAGNRNDLLPLPTGVKVIHGHDDFSDVPFGDISLDNDLGKRIRHNVLFYEKRGSTTEQAVEQTLGSLSVTPLPMALSFR